MILRHLRAVAALIFLALAMAVGAAPGVSQAATAASPSPPASPGAAQGGIGIKLLDIPASQANDPQARASIVDRLAPGAVLHRKFEVSNLGTAPLPLLVYPAAATIANGTFQISAGHTQNLMTTWISLSQGALTLAPHSSATIEATITVPGNAPSGGGYGVIWAEQSSTGKGNVHLISRIGIRVILSIGPGGAAPASFTLGTPVTSRTSAGVPVVRVPVHNTGGAAVDVHGTLQLSNGPGGVSAGPFHTAAVLTFAPGQSGQSTFDLTAHLPDGPWQASYTMVSGVITETGKAIINFNGTAKVTPTAHTSFPVIPVVGAIAAVIILAIAALLITRSRRMARARKQH